MYEILHNYLISSASIAQSPTQVKKKNSVGGMARELCIWDEKEIASIYLCPTLLCSKRMFKALIIFFVILHAIGVLVVIGFYRQQAGSNREQRGLIGQ